MLLGSMHTTPSSSTTEIPLCGCSAFLTQLAFKCAVVLLEIVYLMECIKSFFYNKKYLKVISQVIPYIAPES